MVDNNMFYFFLTMFFDIYGTNYYLQQDLVNDHVLLLATLVIQYAIFHSFPQKQFWMNHLHN